MLPDRELCPRGCGTLCLPVAFKMEVIVGSISKPHFCAKCILMILLCEPIKKTCKYVHACIHTYIHTNEGWAGYLNISRLCMTDSQHTTVTIGLTTMERTNGFGEFHPKVWDWLPTASEYAVKYLWQTFANLTCEYLCGPGDCVDWCNSNTVMNELVCKSFG